MADNRAPRCVDDIPSNPSRRERGNRSERNVKTGISAGRLLTQHNPFQTVDPELGLPHQYIGYPTWSAFLARSDDFMKLRRFGFLHVRLALDKQAEIRRLERELENSGNIDNVPNAFRTRHSMRPLRDTPDVWARDPMDPNQHRRLLLDEIQEKLSKYSKSGEAEG